MKDKKFLTLSTLFFLLFIAAMSTVMLEKPTSQILRAKNSVPSPLKSFVIVFPQVGVAGSQNGDNTGTKIKISVYMRDVNGNVLPDRTVKLSSSLEGVTISPADQQVTDNIGQAQFYLTSTSTGKAELTAIDVVSNTKIVNVPTVEFTQ
ncbi:Ig-like domain-containing protein [Patescibacteria group bacterium]|nr:Ig-like domain-containing protein [Patescibacteria group bacterium]MCL5797448.1 Ig-like domain-containing protein [Patescibacteria group bacterium]